VRDAGIQHHFCRLSVGDETMLNACVRVILKSLMLEMQKWCWTKKKAASFSCRKDVQTRTSAAVHEDELIRGSQNSLREF